MEKRAVKNPEIPENEEKGKTKRKKIKNKRISRLRLQMCLTCILAAALTAAASYGVLVSFSNQVIKRRASSMVASFNAQIAMSVDIRMDSMEDSCRMVYSDPENYGFDASEETDEEKCRETRGRITGRLEEIEVLENYVELGILYSNGEVAGRINPVNATQEFYEELKTDLEANDIQTDWVSGAGGDESKIAYVKRLNTNALLYASFYIQELERILDPVLGIGECGVYIVDEEWNPVCPVSVQEKDGQILKLAKQFLRDSQNAEYYDAQQVFAVNESHNGWRVVSVVDVKAMLKDNNKPLLLLILVVAFITGSAVLSILLSRLITRPLNNMVEALSERADNDLLTGCLNKKPFEQAVGKVLQEEQYGEAMALILTDVDDFKNINDTYGHMNGDKVLAQYGEILREVFREEVVGRIGGDEFAVLAAIPRYEREKQYIVKKMAELRRRVEDIKVEELQVTISIGVAVRQYSEGDFKQLYGNADIALYQTKVRGKNGYTIFQEE